MARLWDIGLAVMMTSALLTVMFLKMLESPDDNALILQNSLAQHHCVEESIYCDASIDYSYLMETNPVAAALWTPCHTRLSSRDGMADVPSTEGGAQETFTVGVCTSVGEMSVHVVHHDQHACTVSGATAMEAMGVPRSDVVKDYIEVLLDGPERRLRRLQFTSVIMSPNASNSHFVGCEYRLKLPVYATGTYRVQVVVVHSNIGLVGVEPYSNYVLWDRTHTMSVLDLYDIADEPQIETSETWPSTGVWLRIGNESFPGRQSAQAWIAQKWNNDSYRCPANGTASYKWVPSSKVSTSKTRTSISVLGVDYKPLHSRKAMSCARALSPQHKTPYPKLVLFGDSLMRQTFNAVALAIGMQNVTAIKEFKSLMESQDWGGPSLGLEFSFQWAARHNEGRDTCKQ